MEFRTPIHITPSPAIRIGHDTSILTLGSCFANVIGERLQKSKFNVSVNPFGVVFNPISICKLLEAASEGMNPFRNSFIQNQGIWFNFDFHSSFSSVSKEELDTTIAKAIENTQQFLKHAKVITITFGTAFVYKLNLTEEVVANCHKVPAFNFEKTLLSTHEIVKRFEKLYLSLKYLNPNIQFILTVSPVRHIKDGIEANSVSKSILRISCHEIVEKFQDAEYFPSYEIVMDDLRDYRFYKEDMIHTTEVAENYIWEKFLQKYVTPESKEIISEWSTVQRAIAHRPFHPESEAHQKFLKETIARLKGLSNVIQVEKEIKELESKLL